MTETKITQQDIDQMIRHWLATPIGTYVGSDYGFDKYALLFKPMSSSAFDEMIAKLKSDVPILTMLRDDAINFYSLPIGVDKAVIFLQIGDSTFNIV